MWKDKPALYAALVISCGILSAYVSALSWQTWGVGVIVCLLISIAELWKRKNVLGRQIIFSAWCTFLLFFAAALSYSSELQLQSKNSISFFADTQEPIRITCKVIDEPRVSKGRTTATVEMISVSYETDSLTVDGKAILTIQPDKRRNEQPTNIMYGSILSFDGTVESPSSARNPGEFSYRDYLALNNIFATIHVYGYSKVSVSEQRETNWFFEKIIFPSKNFITRTILVAMKGDEANFLIGLLLGDRTDISAEIKSAFINTGTIHVLAVSGSHVALVVVIIYAFFGVLRLPRSPKIIATIFAIIYYMYLTNATPSVVRASLMAIVVLLGKLVQEKSSVYNNLGISAVIIFLVEPKQLFDVGFQLSFSAVFSMTYFYPKLEFLIKNIPQSLARYTWIEKVMQLFALTLAAQIGTIPFTAYYFGKVSLISFVANLIVVPLVEVNIIIGMSGALLGILSMWIASCFSEVNQLFAWFALWFVKLANQVPLATISTAAFGLKETFFYSTVVGMVFNLRNKIFVRRTILVVFAVSDIFLLASLVEQRLHPLRVTFFDVGQGDAALIQFPTGETMLVDGGPKTLTYDAGEKIVLPFLRRNEINNLDVVLVTHPHADHLGGVPAIMRSLPVKKIIIPNQRAQSLLYTEFENQKRHTTTTIAMAGNIISEIPNARLYLLHPTTAFLDSDSSDGYTELNNVSVVFKLQYGATSFLFVGDAETPVEEQLDVVYGDFLRSDVLKAGHHGSITSSSEEFVHLVHPMNVVVSVAKFNKFRHPSKVVLERYNNIGAHIYRTDADGAIIFESDGKSVQRVNWKKEKD